MEMCYDHMFIYAEFEIINMFFKERRPKYKPAYALNTLHVLHCSRARCASVSCSHYLTEVRAAGSVHVWVEPVMQRCPLVLLQRQLHSHLDDLSAFPAMVAQNNSAPATWILFYVRLCSIGGRQILLLVTSPFVRSYC